MAKRQDIIFTGVIDTLERVNSSVNGNPRFRIYWKSGGTSLTQSDASVSYGLENRENVGVPVEVKATRSGYVWGVRPLTDVEVKRWKAQGEPGPDKPARLETVELDRSVPPTFPQDEEAR